MHVANGLNIPSVIIFGGSRPLKCFGYEQNLPLIANRIAAHVGSNFAACNESLETGSKTISVNHFLNQQFNAKLK